ncbi:MAG: glycosyltransferase [Candidatus Synoicihabitans palmerolidicus]|nr:glycosyltransferase [Candidatus Synoicihabitans palmerolidicus]
MAEPKLGLTSARRRSAAEARGTLLVLVDDDNVLSRDYLSQALALATKHPQVGAFGGSSVPNFETPPADWQQECIGLLALRDMGPDPIFKKAASAKLEYPLCAPIGVGMCLRRSLMNTWLEQSMDHQLSDRTGTALSSGGDHEIVLAVCAADGDVAYYPALQLTHLIPQSRLQAEYLGRLNRRIQCSWIQVLDRHGIRPVNWSPIAN